MTMNTNSHMLTMASTSVTMTMTGATMTNPPLSLPCSASNFARTDRAYSWPVVYVTDSTVTSCSTTPASPSLTPLATLQQSCLAAPWSGHRSTVSKHKTHNFSSEVTGLGRDCSMSGDSNIDTFPQPGCQPCREGGRAWWSN